MTIHPLVRRIAHQWGLDPALVQAMVQAEGGMDHIVKAVQCSYPEVGSVEKALEITCRSATHRLWEYVLVHSAPGFAEYLGAKWAPVGAANDPHNLNQNWPKNFLASWLAR